MEQNTANIDRLFSLEPYAGTDESKSLFMKSLKDELIFHYENNEMYKRFCQRKGFDPYGDYSIKDIPPIAVSVFKNLGNNLGSVGTDDIKLRLQSSATSGTPSTVVVDKITSKRQSKAMVKVIQSFIGNKIRPFLVMDIDPRAGFGAELGARFAAVSGYLKFSSKTGYFLKTRPDGTSYFDVEYMKKFVEEIGDTPVVLFGFTYILFSNVLKEIDSNETDIKLPAGSKILHIGGWKKLESEKIGKDIFNERISKCFGIESKDVIDVYGFTEQMGLNYPDCTDGWKRTSVFSEVIARNPVTHEILPYGEEGVLEFITPIPHSYPGNAVLTDDLGIVAEPTECDGKYGTRFKVTGRMKKAEIRGCGDILSHKLTFKKISHNDNRGASELKVIMSNADIKSSEPKEQLKEVCDELRKNRERLEKQPIDAIIGLIASVSSKWITNPELQHLKDKGLVFISSWLDKKNLTAISQIGLKGNIDYMDKFCPCPDSDKHLMKASPRGLVCHWLAGNVQILGMFALVQSILSKNVNLLRVSSKDDGVFQCLLDTFRGEEYVTENGYIIKGDDLLKTIALVSYPHDDDELGEYMSSQADVRIAWGGREAVQTVAGYPSKIGAETVIFGPKLSFAAISREGLSSEKDAKSLAKKLAVDVSVFDQTGCASPHNLYIEDGGAVSADRFIELLAEEMEKAEVRIPKPETPVEQISQIHSIRGVYDFKGRVIGSSSLSWTLLIDDDNSAELCSPVYSRVLFIHKVNSIFDCLKNVTEDIQTIGLAAPIEKGIKFADEAVKRGVARLPQIGRMLNFEMPWDGIYLFDGLVRWNTLGGPLR